MSGTSVTPRARLTPKWHHGQDFSRHDDHCMGALFHNQCQAHPTTITTTSTTTTITGATSGWLPTDTSLDNGPTRYCETSLVLMCYDDQHQGPIVPYFNPKPGLHFPSP